MIHEADIKVRFELKNGKHIISSNGNDLMKDLFSISRTIRQLDLLIERNTEENGIQKFTKELQAAKDTLVFLTVPLYNHAEMVFLNTQNLNKSWKEKQQNNLMHSFLNYLVKPSKKYLKKEILAYY